MPDEYGNYSEEEIKLLSESYSKINVWRDGILIIKDGVKVDYIINSSHKIRERSTKFQEDLQSHWEPIRQILHRV